MLKNKKFFVNKKAVEISIKAVVRLIIAVAVLFLIVFPACNKLRSYFFGADTGSFEAFVEGINEMSSERADSFVLRLNEKSAVIGFGKGANRYECFNCYVGIANPRPTIVVNRPDSPECADGACVCLCDKSFKLEGENPKIGQCGELLCKKIDPDIVSKTIIKKYSGILGIGGGTEHWNNGFLFVNGVSGANGLKLYNEKATLLYVEKRANLIGVCNADMLEFNNEEWKLDGCINKDKS